MAGIQWIRCTMRHRSFGLPSNKKPHLNFSQGCIMHQIKLKHLMQKSVCSEILTHLLGAVFSLYVCPHYLKPNHLKFNKKFMLDCIFENYIPHNDAASVGNNRRKEPLFENFFFVLWWHRRLKCSCQSTIAKAPFEILFIILLHFLVLPDQKNTSFSKVYAAIWVQNNLFHSNFIQLFFLWINNVYIGIIRK